MIRYKTRNSTYEVDLDGQQARFVEGENGPTGAFSPAGEWKPFQDYAETAHPFGGFVLSFLWPSGGYTTTSLVDSSEYRPEPFEVPSCTCEAYGPEQHLRPCPPAQEPRD